MNIKFKIGGVGLITYKISDKTGKLVGATICKDTDELMLINSSGIAIRINVSDISVTSRSAMGVTLMRTSNNEKVVAVAKIANNGEDKEPEKQLELNVEEENKGDMLSNSIDSAITDIE